MRRSPACHIAVFQALFLCVSFAHAGAASLPGAGSIAPGRSLRAEVAGHAAYIRNGSLRLHLRCDRRCCVDSLWIGETMISAPAEGCYTGFLTGNAWHTSRTLDNPPYITSSGDSISIGGIQLLAGADTVNEAWTFSLSGENVIWTIERTLAKPLSIDDNAFPAISVSPIGRFDGALLDNGGVAWFRLFNDTVLAYGVHTQGAAIWSADHHECLSLEADPADGRCAINILKRGETATCAFSVSKAELSYRFDAETHRRRFIRGETDVWQSATYPAGTYRVSVSLSAPDYETKFGRGKFKGVNGDAVTSIENTIARLGVIDSRHYGGNSWHTPYGPICLHEQYIARFGVAIDDPNYVRGYRECLNFYRDHAILPDGRVKSRWAYTDEDAAPGSADSLGFYEAQWGILMDSQPDFVINVAEEFDLCGDRAWLRSHKTTCERVLDYVLQRDMNHNYLVEMATRSYKDARGSDWIDVIWASWENALVNAEVYRALTLWSGLEDVLGDSSSAAGYRAFAGGLKAAFNRSLRDGGFWDEDRQWYVHWREPDGSAYGNNLVTPVNFMAIAYGICDDPARKKAILETIEAAMQREHLFIWPLCMFPYEPGVGLLNVNYPYPSYENGDIFLSWAEMGMKAYAEESPAIAYRYCRNVIGRYLRDGLAFQRYLRGTQEGAGDDILAGNASAIVGLYADIYGIQPRYNRLLLSPHLVGELYGTKLLYNFQGRSYTISLDRSANAIGVDGMTFSFPGAFAIKRDSGSVTWYAGENITSGMALSAPGASTFEVHVDQWGEKRVWRELIDGGHLKLSHLISGLVPGGEYALRVDGKVRWTRLAAAEGTLRFTYPHNDTAQHHMELDMLPARIN